MKIDVYDFDKTIYDGDSTIDFYLYCIRKEISLLKFIPIQILYFIKYKLKLVKKKKFKEKFFSFLCRIENIDKYIVDFWEENEKKIRYEMIKKTDNKKYIISASPEFLLEPILKRLENFELIASKVNKENGKFESENCYGEEKVKRLNDEVNEEFEIENFYSDSNSDEYLAEISQNSYLVRKNGRIEKWKK